MIINVFFAVSLYPVLFLMFFMVKGSMHCQKGLSFGLHPPKEEEKKAAFLRCANEQEALYQKRMKRNFLICAAAPVATFFIPYVSIQITIWLSWLLAVIAAMMLPFIQANRAIVKWKRENTIKEKTGERYVEIKDAGEVRRARFAYFAPFVLISLLLGVLFVASYQGAHREAASVLVGTFAVTTPFFYLAARWMDGQRVTVISMDSEINLNYARAKKNCWKDFWLVCAAGNTLAVLLSALWFAKYSFSSGMVLLLSAACVFLCLGAVVWLAKKLKKLDEIYQKRPEPIDLEDDGDEDEHWIFGMFYYNKNDRHNMIEQRYGMGTTVNMARPVGKAFFAVGAIALLSLPILCIWLVSLEFTPIELTVKDQQLVASQLKTDYRIPLDKIEELALIENLPNLSKIKGTGMDNLCKGKFHAASMGDCEVFLNPKNQVFLSFRIGDMLYYMSAAQDEETLAIYEELKGRGK